MKIGYNICPNTTCGRKLDGAIDPDDPNGRSPEPGDVSICTHCETFLVFDETMTLQYLNPDQESPATMLGLNEMLKFVRELKINGELE